jgi:hypothetical protein
LDAIGFVWDPITQQWEEGFAALARFREREGHCLVWRSHKEDGHDGKLGGWVSNQRTNKTELSAERTERLGAIGFVWDPITQQWEEGFAALARFKEREGHCLVKFNHKEDGHDGKLGGWVSNQRTNKTELSAERTERLDAIGFVWSGRITSKTGPKT